jgi:hypothetical protein
MMKIAFRVIFTTRSDHQSLRIWSDKIAARRRGRIIIIITRFDCVWMQTQKSPNDPHIRIRACGCKFHHYQLIRMATIFKMATNKISKISMFFHFNENLYLGLFWSEELIGNDENCIQGHFYDATVSKMATSSRFPWQRQPFWKFHDFAPLEMEIHLPVKFSKDRIISLQEFGRTKSQRKSLTSLISDTAKGISTKLGIYIKEGW